VGLYLSFDPPSAHSLLQCLKFAILPKDKLNEEFTGLRNDWPVAGTFTTLVCDNSLDAHGDRIKTFCLAIGASIQYCPSRTPWFKGAVERYFRTQNTGVLHKLPGTTFSNPKERADYPSQELCRFERKHFWHLLLRWVVDVYHITPHRTTGMPPIERWRRNAATREFDFPVSPADLQIMAARSTERQLQHYGLELNHLKYNSAALQDVYRVLSVRGGRRDSTTTVEVRHHDDTVAYVDVLDPTSNIFIRVPALDQDYAKNLDRFTHLLVHRNLNREFGRKWRLHDRREALEDIRAMVAVAGERKRKLSRQVKRTERAEKAIDQLVRRQHAKNKPQPRSQKVFLSRMDAALPELTPIDAPHLAQEPPNGG
jgi:putative transposase